MPTPISLRAMAAQGKAPASRGRRGLPMEAGRRSLPSRDMSSPTLTVSTDTARLSRTAAFWLLAATLALMLFASSAPSPLYVVYQQQWSFSPITLTSVFAVYALALLASLLVAGS